MHIVNHRPARAPRSYPVICTAYPLVFRSVSHIFIHSLGLSRVLHWYSPGFSTVRAQMRFVWTIQPYHFALIPCLSQRFQAELHQLLHIFIHRDRMGQ
jgi:hypothetical protein